MEKNEQEAKKETSQIGSIEAQSLDQTSRQPQMTSLNKSMLH